MASIYLDYNVSTSVESTEAIIVVRMKGLLSVDMEAAALYAFGSRRGRPVLCFAHVTNQMGRMKVTSKKAKQTAPPICSK